MNIRIGLKHFLLFVSVSFFTTVASAKQVFGLQEVASTNNQKQIKKTDKLGLSWADLFSNQQGLFNQKTQEFSQFNLDFTAQKEHLKQQFASLHQIALQTDSSFGKAVKAQEVKQLKGLDNLEKRLLKAEKRQHADALERIIQLQNELFPNQSLQERRNNFSEFYLEFGHEFIDKLHDNLKPLASNFTILVL